MGWEGVRAPKYEFCTLQVPLSLGCTWVSALSGDFFWEIEKHFRLFEMIVNFTIKINRRENHNKIQKI